MAKDYFQDILPPQGGPAPRQAPPREPTQLKITSADLESEDGDVEGPDTKERSIRNVQVTTRAPRRATLDDVYSPEPPTGKRGAPRIWMWLAAALAVIVLGVIFALSFRPTSVIVIPRDQVAVFDSSVQYRAFPASNAPTGMLSYTLETSTFEDSGVVAANGTERVEEYAKGMITVVNNYQTAPLKLIKNTRFETPDGLIFKTPAEVMIPGKTASKPGEKEIQVVAEAVGEKYNVGPTTKFTLPGLKSTPAMYSTISARSSQPMSGGFSGERPKIDQSTLNASKAEIRARLETQARESVQSKTTESTVALSGLMRITYTTLAPTTEAGGGVRIREEARVEVPVFPAELLARTVGRGISADAESGIVMLEDPAKLSGQFAGESTPALGSEAFDFSISGSTRLIWKVDTEALLDALVGKEKAAFEAIVAGFPGIKEARARVQPFWKGSFPEAPDDIRVQVESPKAL